MRKQTKKKINLLLIIVIIVLIDAQFLISSFTFVDQIQPSSVLGEAAYVIRASHPKENTGHTASKHV